jgi:hypothetical protein
MEKITQINLRKEKVINLKKSKGIEKEKSTVILALDFSGSMRALFKNGEVQELIERILPLGLAFDDNGEVDFYLFSTSFDKLKENITIQNIFGYVDKKIIGNYKMGGTNYAPVIKEIVKEFGNKKSGNIFGLNKKIVPLEYPVYVIFITDGGNSDKSDATKAIIEASDHGIFFQFIGIGNDSFSFLAKLDTMGGRFIDNANFFKIENLSKKTDEELYSLLLNEFPQYIVEARSKSLIK